MKGCRRCTYWQCLDIELERDDPAIMGKKVDLGLCRRYAPQPGAETLAANGGNGEALDSAWPKVASDEWCGEWQPDVG